MLGLAAVAVALPTATGTALAGPSSGAVDITFPVPAGEYTDDYHADRSNGRTHQATDIFNDPGTPVHAAVGGTVGWAPASEQPSAGFALQIEGDDGRTYAYYHLGEANGARSGGVANGLSRGDRVERGELIGYLGNSGNAVNTGPHLHFEIHAAGGGRLNPFHALQAAEARGDYPGASGGGAAEAAASKSADSGSTVSYTVVSGDTLSSIAGANGGASIQAWADANPGLGDPDVINPGDVLAVP